MCLLGQLSFSSGFLQWLFAANGFLGEQLEVYVKVGIADGPLACVYAGTPRSVGRSGHRRIAFIPVQTGCLRDGRAL